MDSDSTYFDPEWNPASCQTHGQEGQTSSLSIAGIEVVHVSASGPSIISKGIMGDEAVAVKSLKDGYRGVPFYEEALRKEAEVMRGLDNPYICKYIDFGQVEGLGNSLVTRWEEGVTLTEKMDAGISPALLRKFTLQLCEALEYAHSLGIVHRDLKPDNIIITRNGEDVRLADFGFADADWHIRCKTPAGSLKYCPPEQISGKRPDVRSDIYSFGTIVGEMSLSLGRREARKWRKIVSKCVEPSPEDRFQSMSEVRKAIFSIEKRRKMIPVALGVFTLALIVCGAVFFSSDTYRLMRQRQEARQCVEEVTRVILEAGAPDYGEE